jgi:serine/threonine-protein kinase RsbW
MMQAVVFRLSAGHGSAFLVHPSQQKNMPRFSSSRTNPSDREPNSALETTTRTLNSMLQVVDSVENDALEYARRAGFHGITLEKIGLAVREIVNNAIIHGNRLDGQKKVIVRIARTTNQITITVWDQGKGFDLDSLPDPHSPEVLLRRSGRGIYFARAFMDEFHVQPGPAGGTTVVLVKYIRENDYS